MYIVHNTVNHRVAPREGRVLTLLPIGIRIPSSSSPRPDRNRKMILSFTRSINITLKRYFDYASARAQLINTGSAEVKYMRVVQWCVVQRSTRCWPHKRAVFVRIPAGDNKIIHYIIRVL